MIAVDFDYDTDRWIRVPLDYADTRWRDADEWAQWLATSATAGRDDVDAIAPLVRAGALEVALFPAAHVWARFWHYPVDAIPTGFIDIYIQQRTADGTVAEDLLPEPGLTALTPVLDVLETPGYVSAARRRSLVLVLRSDDPDDVPAAMPRIEWLGVTDQWVCYIVTNDHDPAIANERAADVDALFGAIGAADAESTGEAR